MGLVRARDPVTIVAIGAFFMKEPPRGQYEKQHVLGEVIEEAKPAPISMEAAFARLKKIATIRTVLVAFCALGFGLFSQGTLSSLYLEKNLHVTDAFDRGLILSLSASRRCRSCPSWPSTSTGCTGRTPPKRSPSWAR